MEYISKTYLIILMGIAFMATGLMSESEAAFYEGKTITMLSPAPAGGGVSRTGSLFIKHMRKHLEGNPNIIMKNMPGGGGVKALNYLADKGKPDGLMFYWGNLRFLGILLDFPGVRFGVDNFDYVGMGSITYASLMRKDFPPGINTPADLLKAKDFKIAGQGPASGLDVFSKLPLDILGISYKYIPGYKGQPQFNAAIRSKEVNFLTTGVSGFHIFYKDTLVKDGTLLPLYYHSPLDENGNPLKGEDYPQGMQSFIDYAYDSLGKKLSGAQYEAYQWICSYNTPVLTVVVPKGVDKNILSQLRKAHAATIADPEFKADYIKQFTTWPIWGSGEQYEKLAKSYDQLSPGALAVLKKMTAKKKKE